MAGLIATCLFSGQSYTIPLYMNMYNAVTQNWILTRPKLHQVSMVA